MKYLDSNGLKSLITKIKEKFYTKDEVDTKLKNVGGVLKR